MALNLNAILPLEKLGITLQSVSETEAVFHVPLAPNVNDKGTLFAGSQYSGLVIAGWTLASHWAEVNGLGDKVAIKDCSVSYPNAATKDVTVTASFQQTPDERPSGHTRALIRVQGVDSEGTLVSELKGDYRILKPASRV